MSGLNVTVDASRAERMFEQLARNAQRAAIDRAIERAAGQAVGMITGVPRGDTGELQQLFFTTLRNTATIRTRAPYGWHVLRGSHPRGGPTYVPGRPPNVPRAAIAGILAREIQREVFRA